ncbi:eamA-like transporter family protein [Hirsutella rhossiliensis]|uniref:GDP-mannose transporter n=1 Tax=Hirsutella rhossiliensis TaxID=111463 RepID=A0A9P8MQ28_9HYPO|nr:eamA-like transporter family domain-containing protein [Hirsutella rhossiliensis]KAH0959215.1 eamA-like transporter family domain-containing protein [Hirsutella rhossiliensis]
MGEKLIDLLGTDDCESALPVSLSETQLEQSPPSSVKAVFWIVVNTLATVGIVFVNKAIFSDPSWKLCQLAFACFHFMATWLALFVLSRPRFAFFVPRHAPFRKLVPLAMAMCLNVVLPNLSLAFSSVTFYQVARILLTPVVAILNFVLYRATLPRMAIISLIPVCIGVGVVSYYDSLPASDATVKTTSSLGIVFAFSGIFASSLYTIWVGNYHTELKMSSMQLLYNQAPIASLLLVYAIPFCDTLPQWTAVPLSRWLMILLSGVFALLINISQFFIVAQAGAVSSTVVGHLKTCTIVVLGWIVSGRAIGDKSIIGIILAISGIVA